MNSDENDDKSDVVNFLYFFSHMYVYTYVCITTLLIFSILDDWEEITGCQDFSPPAKD